MVTNASVLAPNPEIDPDELETITMHKILETTTFFQRAVYLVSGISRLILKENGLLTFL